MRMQGFTGIAKLCPLVFELTNLLPLLILFSNYVIEVIGTLIFDNQKWRQKS